MLNVNPCQLCQDILLNIQTSFSPLKSQTALNLSQNTYFSFLLKNKKLSSLYLKLRYRNSLPHALNSSSIKRTLPHQTQRVKTPTLSSAMCPLVFHPVSMILVDNCIIFQTNWAPLILLFLHSTHTLAFRSLPTC